MRRMSDYYDFPPMPDFRRVLQIAPASALIYISLWKMRRNNNDISIKKSDVKKKFLISKTIFRNHLLALSRLEILSFEETTDFFLVYFISIGKSVA